MVIDPQNNLYPPTFHELWDKWGSTAANINIISACRREFMILHHQEEEDVIAAKKEMVKIEHTFQYFQYKTYYSWVNDSDYHSS